VHQCAEKPEWPRKEGLPDKGSGYLLSVYFQADERPRREMFSIQLNLYVKLPG
jgi:hypothetical protein